jgi:SAM-dependent methyltransferase
MISTGIQGSDETGAKTLNVISEADKFNEWIYQTINPFCKGMVFEVGSGLGNISCFFLRDNHQIMLSDIRQDYCETLNEKFKDYPNLLNIENLDLIDFNFNSKYRACKESFDSVFAINVIEHISDDNLAIDNCYKLLRKGGNLIIMVPSYQILYNNLDKKLGHFKRYTLKSISDILGNHDFNIIHRQYFNFVGLIGWFISGSILKNKRIPQNQMKLFNRIVPICKLADKLILRSFGLSAIVVGRK